jgi:hypothetical protein
MKLAKIQKQILRFIHRTYPTPTEENGEGLQRQCAIQPPTKEQIRNRCGLGQADCDSGLEFLLEHNFVRKVYRHGKSEVTEIQLSPGQKILLPVALSSNADVEDRGCDCYQITKRGVELATWRLWKKITLTGTLGVLALFFTLAFQFDWFGLREPKIDVPGPPPQSDTATDNEHHVPNGNGLPTVVGIENPGQREVLIQQVIFHDIKPQPTPSRGTKWGQAPPIPIIFKPTDFDAAKNQFVKRLAPPRGLKPEWTTLEISIVDPSNVGTTYVGTITIIFNGEKRHAIKNLVELDVVAEEPKQDDSSLDD